MTGNQGVRVCPRGQPENAANWALIAASYCAEIILTGASASRSQRRRRFRPPCNTPGRDTRSHTSPRCTKNSWSSANGRLRWAEKAGTGFTLPGHQQGAAETANGMSGKILEFRKVG